MQDPQPAQLKMLARVLLAEHDQAACDRCLDQVEDYIAAQLAGQDYAALFPAVAAHLDSCLACAAVYNELYELQAMAAFVPEPAAIPAPDLSFLEPALPALAQGVPNLADALAAAVEQLGSQLRFTLTSALLGLAPSQPSLAFRSESDAQPVVNFTLVQPTEQVAEFGLSIYRLTSSEHCQVRVQLSLPEREWPDLAGVPVRLIAAGDVRQQISDAWGEVVFEQVPLAALDGLQVEIDPAQ